MRIRVLITLAYAEAETGSVSDGLPHLDTAQLLFAELQGPQRAHMEGVVGCQRALLLHRAGQTAESLDLFNQAIPLLEHALGSGACDASVLTANVMNRGLTYIAYGKPALAEQDMHRTMLLAETHQLPLLRAKAQHNLGDIALLVGDVPTALRHYEETERAFRELAPGLVPRLQIDQARALLTAGLPDEAAEQLDEALPELRRHKVGQDLAEAEVIRAAAALLQGDLELARRLASAAQRRFRRRGSESWSEVAALTKMRAEAAVALSNGVPSVAAQSKAVQSKAAQAKASQAKAPRSKAAQSRAAQSKAARLAERLSAVGLTDEAAMARMLAVRLAVRRGAAAEAGSLVRQVPKPTEVTPIDHRMLLRLCRAELSLTSGDRQRALSEARSGLDELGQVRDRMGGLDLLCGTAVHGRELGELAVRLVLADAETETDARQLFAWLERTRAQVYRYEPQPSIDDPLLAERVAEMRSLGRVVQQSRLDGRAVAELEARYDVLQREVTRLGWHTSQWGRPRPVCELADVVAQLGERALVSFTGQDESLSAVVVAAGRTTLVRLGSASQTVEEVARQLHADLDVLAPDHLPDLLAQTIARSARRRAELLDELLVRPLLPTVGERELVVVPTGSLYAVPWGVLPSLRGRPVVVVPSATAWLTAENDNQRATGSGHVVLVGGPGLTGGVGEVRGLRRTYPAARFLDADQAVSANVLALLDGAELAHLAAHGAHQPDNALFSRLELVDGPLFAHDIARLRRPPRRVVLAACELALSHIRPGDEALGFAGALLASGSHTVVAAVSRVGDQAAAETMQQFHARLATGAGMAQALAESTAADPLRRPFVCFGSGG
ncbi:CHAT domain-containing protein [Goodfellowiella coeruleoviolacea]|uniref:CHAT domain-containing protein n=1 Tax=Goodfellowiella coeruleoviolacea TaxID=334858 RepID=A0AAE3GCG5_9PSEU|nr:CHAT domain-containing protein [Goodfellowiella coeruleoviolacea]MCP2164865.1 CHAT domain-containing protein [Goodfellowiella coeruleoviolacea]